MSDDVRGQDPADAGASAEPAVGKPSVSGPQPPGSTEPTEPQFDEISPSELDPGLGEASGMDTLLSEPTDDLVPTIAAGLTTEPPPVFLPDTEVAPEISPASRSDVRDCQLMLTMLDVGLIPQEKKLFRRSKETGPSPAVRQQQVRDMVRLLDPDMIVMHGVADPSWAAELGRSLLPALPKIAYRASAGGDGPGGGIAILSRHRFVDTQFRPLMPLSNGRTNGPEPGILLTTQDAGKLGRMRLAVLECGSLDRRARHEPRLIRSVREQVKDIVTTVMDADVTYPTLLLGTPPVWPRNEQAAWASLMTAGMVDGLMAGAPPARQGIYDPVAGGLAVDQRHHLFMRTGDFASMFIDKVETVEGTGIINLARGAWMYVHRRRPLRVTLTPRDV